MIDGLEFWHQIQGVLRVVLGKDAGEGGSPALLGRALVRATGTKSPEQAQKRLDEMAARGFALYERLVARPAATVRAAHPDHKPTETKLP